MSVFMNISARLVADHRLDFDSLAVWLTACCRGLPAPKKAMVHSIIDAIHGAEICDEAEVISLDDKRMERRIDKALPAALQVNDPPEDWEAGVFANLDPDDPEGGA